VERKAFSLVVVELQAALTITSFCRQFDGLLAFFELEITT